MTPLHDDLSFNAPLSDAHAAELIDSLGELTGAEVMDLGCGWGELLLRTAGSADGAVGTGVDLDPELVARGNAQAVDRGLGDRVSFEAGDASAVAGPADVVLCVGSSHAWGGTEAALAALRAIVRPGGRVLFGEGFWAVPPTPAAVAALGGTEDEFGTLADLVGLAEAAGFGVWTLSEATPSEWDAFESGYCRGWERALLADPADTASAQRLAEHRRRWLRGYRGVLGFAYLTLVAR